MDSLPKVSVIILNAFRTADLEECLVSLKNTDYPDYEIIVVDCMTEGIAMFLSTKFPDVRLIALKEDIGPSAMHNVGMQNSDPDSRYLAFLDNDIAVDPSWLNALVQCINGDGKIGAVQSKIMLYDKPGFFNTRGNKANFLAVGWPDGYNEPDDGDIREKEIAFPSGACMIMRREALEKVGGYDPDYFIYADDMDTGFRIFLAGYRILSCPRSVIFHKYRFLRNPRNFYYLNRNRMYTFLKLYETKTYIKLIPPIMVYETAMIGYALLNGYLLHLLRAYADVLKNIRQIQKKRSQIREYKKISDDVVFSSLEGGVHFPEISNHPAVKYLLNPVLEKYRSLFLLKPGEIMTG
jgi:GT2 family glycosyltransferase